MKLRNIIYLAVPALMALAACDNDQQYVPGEPDSPDCMGVYFDEANTTDFIFIPGESAEVTVAMHRLKADAAADVPLLCSATVDGIAFPPTAHFDAGSADTEVVIDCSNMPLKTPARLAINLDPQYTSIYAATLYNYEATAIMSQWENANLDGSPVKFYFTDADYGTYYTPNVQEAVYQPIECDMKVLPGSGMLRISNFVNTGIDITFGITPSPYADFLGYYRLSPLNNYETYAEVYESAAYGDDWYNAWFLVDDNDDEEWPVASLTRLDGAPSELEYPAFYWYSDSYAYEYAYAALKSGSRTRNSASIGMMGVPADDKVALPTYFYLYFSWDGEGGL